MTSNKINHRISSDHLAAAIKELETIRDFIRWGVSQFNRAELCFGHGHENAWDEVVFLTLHALHLSSEEDDRILDARLTQSERDSVAHLLAKRVNERKPAAYLVNEAWFAGLPFYVDERVIIPRSPIAELIEARFQPWLANVQVHRILDLCTGSGCIAITCAHAFPDADVDAVEINLDAIKVCHANIEKYRFENQVHAIHSGLFDGLANQKYQLIVSNPPYVSLGEWQGLPAEYHYEPKVALQTSQDGLSVVVRILRESSHYLAEDGILVVEVGNASEILSQKYPDVPFLWLTFKRGGHGVLLLTGRQLREYQSVFETSGGDVYVR